MGAGPKRHVWAATGVAALGTAWYLAYVTVGAGTGTIAYPRQQTMITAEH